jgi:hypothetical protein
VSFEVDEAIGMPVFESKTGSMRSARSMASSRKRGSPSSYWAEIRPPRIRIATSKCWTSMSKSKSSWDRIKSLASAASAVRPIKIMVSKASTGVMSKVVGYQSE